MKVIVCSGDYDRTGWRNRATSALMPLPTNSQTAAFDGDANGKSNFVDPSQQDVRRGVDLVAADIKSGLWSTCETPQSELFPHPAHLITSANSETRWLGFVEFWAATTAKTLRRFRRCQFRASRPYWRTRKRATSDSHVGIPLPEIRQRQELLQLDRKYGRSMSFTSTRKTRE